MEPKFIIFAYGNILFLRVSETADLAQIVNNALIYITEA